MRSRCCCVCCCRRRRTCSARRFIGNRYTAERVVSWRADSYSSPVSSPPWHHLVITCSKTCYIAERKKLKVASKYTHQSRLCVDDCRREDSRSCAHVYSSKSRKTCAVQSSTDSSVQTKRTDWMDWVESKTISFDIYISALRDDILQS